MEGDEGVGDVLGVRQPLVTLTKRTVVVKLEGCGML